MTKPTPGPWKDHGSLIIGPDGAIICMIADYMQPDVVRDPNGKANAQLIIAAPELLAALQTIVPKNACYGDYLIDEDIDRAHDAIAKATGSK